MEKRYRLITDFGKPSDEGVFSREGLRKELIRLRKMVERNDDFYEDADLVVEDLVVEDLKTGKELTERQIDNIEFQKKTKPIKVKQHKRKVKQND